MPDYPGIDLGESEDIIIVGMGNPYAKTYTAQLPSGNIVEYDPETDTIIGDK